MKRLHLDGELTEHAYAWVNFMPEAARRSMAGVRNMRLKAVLSGPKGTDVSCQPISSTRNSTMLGCRGESEGLDSAAVAWPVAPMAAEAEASMRGVRLRIMIYFVKVCGYC